FNLTDSGAKAFIYEAALADRVPDAADVPDLKLRLSTGGATPGAESFDDLCNAGGSFAPIPVEEEAPAVILYTSGTTGKPKGAILTNLGIVISCMHYAETWNLTDSDRALMAVPATHVTGLVAILLTMVRTRGTTIVQLVFKAADFLALAAAE